MEQTEIHSVEEARQKAGDWRTWASEQDLSWEECVQWSGYFEQLALRFGLMDEFKENGII